MTAATATAGAWVWGDRRFWSDETLNDMLALSDELVAAVGHSHIFVWRRADGSLVQKFRRFIRPDHGWFAAAGGELCLQIGDQVLVCTLATGAMHTRARTDEDPGFPRVTRDHAGYTLTLRWPDGHEVGFGYPNELIRRVSCAQVGGRIAVGRGLSCIDIRDARDGSLIRTLEGAGVGVLAPDGRSIAVEDLADRRVHIGEVDRWRSPRDDAPGGMIEALVCSPDGTRVLVVAGTTGWLLRASDGAPQIRLQPTSAGEQVDPRTRWTADGSGLVGPCGNQVVRWDAHSGAVVRQFEIGSRMKAMFFSVDARGERVAIVGATFPGGLMLVPAEQAVVWDVAQGCELVRIPLEDLYQESIELAPDGRRLALLHPEGVRVVTLPERPGAAVGEVHRGAARTWVGFAADGVHMHELAEDSYRVVRVRGGVVVAERPALAICAFTATADGRWFATATHDGAITVQRSEDFVVRCVVQAPDRATALALAPDGALLFAGGWDPTVHAFRLPDATK